MASGVAAELPTDIAGDPGVLIRQIDRPGHSSSPALPTKSFTGRGIPSNSAAVRLEPSGRGVEGRKPIYVFGPPTRRISRLVTSR